MKYQTFKWPSLVYHILGIVSIKANATCFLFESECLQRELHDFSSKICFQETPWFSPSYLRSLNQSYAQTLRKLRRWLQRVGDAVFWLAELALDEVVLGASPETSKLFQENLFILKFQAVCALLEKTGN